MRRVEQRASHESSRDESYSSVSCRAGKTASVSLSLSLSLFQTPPRARRKRKRESARRPFSSSRGASSYEFVVTRAGRAHCFSKSVGNSSRSTSDSGSTTAKMEVPDPDIIAEEKDQGARSRLSLIAASDGAHSKLRVRVSRAKTNARDTPNTHTTPWHAHLTTRDAFADENRNASRLGARARAAPSR